MITPDATGRARSWRRSLFLVELAAMLPFVAFAGFALITALGSYRAVDEARLRNTAQGLAAAVDAHLGTYVAALRAFATSARLDGTLDAEAFAARSRAVAEPLGGWMVLLGPPPDYRVLVLNSAANQTGLPEQLPAENRQAIAPLLIEVFEHGRPGVSDLFEGSVVKRQIVTAMVPVIRDGQPPRALALSFEPASLLALLAKQDLPPGTFAAVADGRFRLLAHTFDPAGQWVGAPVPGWVAAAVEGKQRTLVVGPGLNGEDNVYAVERLTFAPGWTVTVAEPRAMQQMSAWRAVSWTLAGSAALGLGLVGLFWANRREAVQFARQESAALRAGRVQVERLLAGLPAVIFLREVTPDGTSRRVYHGGNGKAVVGRPLADLADLPNLERLTHPDDTTFARELPRLLRDGRANYEWRIRLPDGGWRLLQTLAQVLTRRPDGSAEIVGYTVDVSARREAEDRAMAAARLASLGEMAAGLAHEIKQPLQSISLAAEIAQFAVRRQDAAEAERRLRSIVEQTQRTAELIERLRRFARGADTLTVLEPVPLAAAIEGALDLTHGALRDAEISVEVALDEPAPVVQGQAVLLEQVLSNLLLNARDALAARAAGAPRRIRITATSCPNGTARLTISDTGGGIAPEIMGRLFEPFVTTKGPDKGTGLGLSICHGVLKSMGGSVLAYNEGEGVVFSITLPSASESKVPDTPDSGGARDVRVTAGANSGTDVAGGARH